MKRISIVAILSLIVCSASIAKPILVAPKATDDLITLERTACFGTCPIYTVSIASDGTVSFQGRQYTKAKAATGKISRKAFRRLVREFEKINYFSLPDEFAPGTKVCPQMITDLPSAI